MSEISQDDVNAAVGQAEIYRMEELDTVDAKYWQATVGEPVNATIQVTGNDEAEAKVNLETAAWEIVQSRQASSQAATTEVVPEKKTRTKRTSKK